MKRNSKGQFQKRAKRRKATNVAKKKKATSKRRASKGGGRRRRAGGVNGVGIMSTKTKAEVCAAAAGYGWLEAQAEEQAKKSSAPADQHALLKVPIITPIGRANTIGLITHFVALNSSGMVRRVADRVSCATLTIGSYKLGKRKFEFYKDDATGKGLSGDSDEYDDEEVELEDVDDSDEYDDEGEEQDAA